MDIQKILPIESLGGNYQRYIKAYRDKKSVTAFGMSAMQKCYMLASGDRSLFIAGEDISAKRYYEYLLEIMNAEDVLYIPQKEEVLLPLGALNAAQTAVRVSAYSRLLRGEYKVAVAAVGALPQRLFDQRPQLKDSLTLKVGQNIDIHELSSQLANLGYMRVDAVAGVGDFSVRGEIVDIFPAGYESGFRLDFFDTEIESIKTFDCETQLSQQPAEGIDILPCSDVFISAEEAERLLKLLSRYSVKNLPRQAGDKLSEILETMSEMLSVNKHSEKLRFLIPFMEGNITLLDYLGEGVRLVLDEPKQLVTKLEGVYKEHFYRFEGLFEKGEVARESFDNLIKYDDVLLNIRKFQCVAFQLLTSKNAFFEPQELIAFSGGAVTKYNQNIAEFIRDLKNWRQGKYNVLIMGGGNAQNIAKQLMDSDIFAGVVESPIFDKITVCEEYLSTGIIFHENKLAIIGTGDIIARKQKSVKRKNKKDVFLAPSIGDYVVHEVHGIGICRGIKQLDGQFGLKDFLMLEYSQGDMLYVPIDQMDMLSKYNSENIPRLNRIGSKDFERIKARVKQSIREMAIDLHSLYLERLKSAGFRFSADTAYQHEFDDRFEYNETDDQIRAISEIKADMESPRSMDRLLCGDVGYGKTEVAYRAMFKAVMDSKQVAMLAPTTILCQQHYERAKERFEGFGVRIEVLNRFKSDKEAREILKRTLSHEVDILIGTHRILSSDVIFSDLGLLVVDEEQRFGVEHKERIKNLKRDVDVLTLSATPIPRTLHMSMVGIRDISILEQPPRERLPVESYIIEQSEGVIADAIYKELSRGGQAFVMVNRVAQIDKIASIVINNVPEAKVVIAHGQMNETALENAVFSFYSGETNVMVCTTIIENGIDIPRANTLIIIDSDTLGLSQLYQLRGRVGRSNRLAYCYFTYKEGKVISDVAYKRLSAIMEFTDFGSGFKIAMRDLELRGAGDIIGANQHGHMDKVGYDMYVKLLGECVSELAGAKQENIETKIDVAIPAFIDESYIKNEEQKMRVYRRIAEVSDFAERENLLSELQDIYGEAPAGVRNLIDISLIKKLTNALGATNVVIKENIAEIEFKGSSVLQNKAFITAAQEMSGECMLNFSDKVKLVFKVGGLKIRQIVKNILKFLKICKN